MDTTLKPPAPKSVDKKYLLLAQTILKGLGQIMLQENNNNLIYIGNYFRLAA